MQSDLTSKVLVEKIYSIDKNRSDYLKHKEKAASIIMIDASKKLANALQSVYEKERSLSKKNTE